MYPSDCVHLAWPRQECHNDRYFAEPSLRFGVCIYNVGNSPSLSVQCFPVLPRNNQLKLFYYQHVMGIAKSDSTPDPLYPYFEAPDVLTLKCLVDEAIEKWRHARCTTNSPR